MTTSMTTGVLVLGAVVGGGAGLLIRGFTPPPADLARLIAERTPGRRSHEETSSFAKATNMPAARGHGPDVRAPRPGEHVHSAGWLARTGRRAVPWLSRTGLPTAAVRADLAVLDRPVHLHLAEQATSTVIAAALVPATVGLLALGGISLPLAVPLWGALLLAVAGFLTPDIVARANARTRRAEFTHALGAFLDLVVISLAGGAGVEAALTEAAAAGHGWAFDRLRHALRVADLTHTAPWTTLSELGDHLDVPALREVSAAVALAGSEGARVRASLAAKASGLRLRELTDAEATAVAATEQMSLPVIIMFAGFLVFIGYPAVTHVFTAL